ncbi:hypothetical protein [Pseudomonas sp.]|uniref:hypothetical protein n=1 Tax=Pseudomonas sp. TaxID=306 RepID=UPI001B267DE9|nr:hypothetical protein [Pseudomonas sp.]MBO9548532.1 hypothetical protein [Pseudomonas sp.]
MNDAVSLFRRVECGTEQPVLLHELEARVSEDGRELIVSRYRERYGNGGDAQRHEVHRRVPIATLLKWMAREGTTPQPS